MTDSSMKSDILLEPKTRSDGRQYWQRRRIAKTAAATVNGEYDPDLAMAIQESLKQAEIESRARASQDNIHIKSEEDHFKENRNANGAGSSQEISEDTQKLKELLLCHMDLIHQQQEMLKERDKTIKVLNTDKNTLQCRLERMERRMSLLKQKEDPQETAVSAHQVPKRLGDTFYCNSSEKTALKAQRKLSLEQSSNGKRLEKTNECKPSPSKVTTTPNYQTPSSTKPKQESHRKRKHCATEVPSETEEDLKTSNLYYVSYYEPISDEIDTECRLDIVHSAKSQLEVETPSWKIRPLTNLYIIEGTENHEDDTFIRRHQKPEIEEKRRKRWDMQRLRDQKMYEKMKEKEEVILPGQKHEEPIDSFYPSLECITHIDVQDKIPVTAFGHSIPYIKPTYFSLPWDPKTQGTNRLRNK